MYLDQYFDAVEAILRQIRKTQRKSIEEAGRVAAATLAQRGAIAVMDTGHLLKHEAHLRAGGLIAITPFSYDFTVEEDLPQRTETRAPEVLAALEAHKVTLALDISQLESGDVMIINSNSGRTVNVVEVALQCRDRGIAAIAICSRAQMEACGAAHPSGQKLFDVVPIAIDNCTPAGDAVVTVKDNEKMCPLSGIASAHILWAVQAHAVEVLQSQGINPSIYRSVHLGGEEFVEEQRAKFVRDGF